MDSLWYPGERNSVVDYLGRRGWEPSTTSVSELFAAYSLSSPVEHKDEAAIFASRTYASATRI
jgi:hypothetical protein